MRFREIRSASDPAGVDTSVYTTLKASSSHRMPATERPRSCARSTRNASAELPNSKITEQATKAANPRPRPRRRRRGRLAGGCSAEGGLAADGSAGGRLAAEGSAAACVLTSRAPTARTATPRNAGRRLHSTRLRKVSASRSVPPPCTCCTTQIDTAIPITAPAVSAARCSPNASPRRSGGVESASRASRGAVRTPFPTRSPHRIAATAPQLEAM